MMNRLKFFKHLLLLPVIGLFANSIIKNRKEIENKCKVIFFYTNKQGDKKKLILFVCKDQADLWKSFSPINKYKHIDSMIIDDVIIKST